MASEQAVAIGPAADVMPSEVSTAIVPASPMPSEASTTIGPNMYPAGEGWVYDATRPPMTRQSIGPQWGSPPPYPRLWANMLYPANALDLMSSGLGEIPQPFLEADCDFSGDEQSELIRMLQEKYGIEQSGIVTPALCKTHGGPITKASVAAVLGLENFCPADDTDYCTQRKKFGWLGFLAIATAATLALVLVRKDAPRRRMRRNASGSGRLKSTAYGGKYDESVSADSLEEAKSIARGVRADGGRARVTFSKGYKGQFPHYRVLVRRAGSSGRARRRT